jgi:hypothetical protein
MPKHRNPFADLPPITDFDSCQKVRPLLMQRLGDLFGVWRGCEDKACVRARSCRRSDGACLVAFMQAVPDHERRLFRHALEHRCDGLDAGEAFERAQARVADEIARFGA